MGRILGLNTAREEHPTRELWGAMSWLVEDRTVPGVGISLARMSVAPGETSPGHSHPNCHEIVHLVSGRIEQTVGSCCYPMSAGDTVVVAPGVAHRTRNLSDAEPAELLVCYSAGTRIYQSEPGAA